MLGRKKYKREGEKEKKKYIEREVKMEKHKDGDRKDI